MDNEFMLKIIALLNKQLSKKSINNDLRTLDNTMYVKVLAKLSKTLAKRELKKQLKELNDLYVKVGANVNIDKDAKNQLQKNIRTLQQSIADLEIGLKASKQEQDRINTEIKSIRNKMQQDVENNPISFNLQIKKDKLISDVEYLGKRYSKLFSNVSATQKYEKLMGNALNVSDKWKLADTRAELSAFTSELKANGLATQSTGDKWKALVERSKDLFSAATLVSTVFSQLKESVATFLELDTAMTGVWKVSDEIVSREQFSGLLTKWNKLAQDLSVTTTSLISSIEEWSKIGFDLDMSEQLAKLTTIFEKTAEISNEKANSTLVSAAQAFTEIGDLGEEDYVERVEAIGNKINAIGNKYAISSEGIADALQNSSAALKMANNDLDEAIAMITAGNKIFQSPDEMGNTLKVISARLRGQKGELEALGEDVEGMIEGVSKVQTQILNLTDNKVNIFESDNETLKSTYDILLEVGKVYESLSDKDQASLLEIMFGKQRMSAGSSLLLNYEELEKVKNDSMNATNSMAEEYAKYIQSAEASIISFKEKLVETYSTFMSGDMIKFAADTGSAILDLVNTTDLLRHSLLAVASINIGKGVSAIGATVASTTKQMNTLGSALEQVKNLPLDDVVRDTAISKLGEATQNLTEKNLKLLLSQKQLTNDDRIAILVKHNLTEEEAKAKLAKMNLTSATNSQSAANVKETATTLTLSGAIASLKTTIHGVGAAMKAAFLANPLGWAFTIISTGASIASTAISNYNQKLEEQREEIKQTASEASKLSSEISDLTSKYLSLSEAVKTDESAKEELLSTQTELLKKLGLEGESIEDLISKYGSLDEAIKQTSLDSLKKSQLDLLEGIDVAEEELLNDAKGGFLNKNIINASGDDAVRAFEELAKVGIVDSSSFGSGGGSLVLFGDDSTVDGALENFKRLEDALSALRDSNAFTAEELSNNSLYHALYSRYSEMEDSVNSYNSAIENLNQNLAQQTMLSALQGSELPKSKEEFETFRQELIETAIASEDFIGNEKEIANAINSYLFGVSEFKEYFVDLAEAQAQITESEPITFDTSTAIEKLKDLEDTMSDLDTAYASLLKGEPADLSSLDGIRESFAELENVDLSVVNDALDQIANAETIGQAQSAMDALATEYLRASGILDGLDESNKDLIATMLKSIGFKEADALVTDALAQKEAQLAAEKYYVTIETELLTATTAEEIKQILAEAEAAGISTAELAKLALAKIDVNNAKINTEDNINQIIALANAAGTSTHYLAQLQSALNNFNSLDPVADGATMKDRANAEKNLENLANKVKNISLDPTDFYAKKGSSSYSYKGGSSSSSAREELAKDAEKASESAKEEFSETVDFFEKEIKNIDNEISLLRANIEKVPGSFAKNALIDKEIGLNTDKINGYSEAITMYTEKAEYALSQLPEDIAQKVRDGSVELIDFVGDNGEAITEVIDEYDTWADKITDCNQQLAELGKTISGLELEKFENISKDFESITDLYDSGITSIDKQISVLEESGQMVGRYLYYKQMEIAESQKDSLYDKKYDLRKQLSEALDSGNIQKGTDEWKEMVLAIEAVDAEILECESSIEKYNNALLENRSQVFEFTQERYSALGSQISNLLELFDGLDIADDKGKWTDEGLAQLGLLAEQYELGKISISEYADEIQKLKQAYYEGKYSATEYSEKLAELKDGQYEAIQMTKDAEKAIMELNEARVDLQIEGIEKEIDAYDELTQSKIEALDAEKELYDQRKSTLEQTNDIAKLEKQIAAMENDNTASTVAKRKQLEAELAEKKQSLADYQYENSIEAQKDALNEQYESFEKSKNADIEALKKTLEDQETIMIDSLEKVKDNASSIYYEIVTTATSNGMSLYDEIVNPWRKGQDAIAGYHEIMDKNTSAFVTNLQAMKAEIVSMQAEADSLSSSLAAMYGLGAVKNANIQKNTYSASKEVSMNRYATGVHNLKKDEVAWTQEKGKEIVLSPSRDAVLTPLKEGDTVLTKRQSDMLYEWSKLNPNMLLANAPVMNLNVAVPKMPEVVQREIRQPVVHNHFGSFMNVEGNVVDTNQFVKQVEKIYDRKNEKTWNQVNKQLKYGGF